jgi:hypothetical protein
MADIRDNTTSVEVYRSLDAAPETWDDARFWLIGELRRIQSGFFSVDEVISNIGSEAPDSPSEGVQGPAGPPGTQGPQGPEGPQGPAGADGVVGDLIKDNQTSLSTTWSSQKIDGLFNALPNPFPEAPKDGQTYGRNNGSWTPIVGVGGSQVEWIDGGVMTIHQTNYNVIEGGNAATEPADITFVEGQMRIL